MKKLIIVFTCLALMPFFKGCGGSSAPEPPKDKLQELQKAADDARAGLKKQYKQ